MQLVPNARLRRAAAFRPGTLKNHWSAQKLYLQFNMVYQLGPDAPSTDSLAAYTEWLLLGGLAVSRVTNHMAAIRSLYLWVDNTAAADLPILPYQYCATFLFTSCSLYTGRPFVFDGGIGAP